MAKKGFAGHKERKRGKKKSKHQEEEQAPPRDIPGANSFAPDDKYRTPALDQKATRDSQEPEEGTGQPSWIIDTEGSTDDRKGKGREAIDHDLIAPFGYVDADVKAYFRDVHNKLQGAEYSLLPGASEDAGAVEPLRDLGVQRR